MIKRFARSRPHPGLGAGLAGLSSLLAGVTMFAAKQASQDMDGLFLTAFRVGIGCICLMPLAGWSCRQLPVQLAARIILLGGIICGVAPWVIIEGLARTDATTTVLVLCLTPIFTLFFAQTIAKENGCSLRWFGALLTVFGLGICLSFDIIWEKIETSDRLVGLGLLVAAALAHASYNVLARKLVSDAGALATTILTLIGGIILLAAILVVDPHASGSLDLSSLPWVLVLFVGAGGAAQSLLWLAALRHAESGSISVLTTLSPLSTITLEALLLDRPVEPHMLTGGVLVLFGLFLALNSCRQTPASKPPRIL